VGIVRTTSESANVLIVGFLIQNYDDILGYAKILTDVDGLIRGTLACLSVKHVKIFNHLMELTELLCIYGCRGSLEFALISK